MAMNLHVATVA